MKFILKLIWSSSELSACAARSREVIYAILFTSYLCGCPVLTLLVHVIVLDLTSDKPSPEKQISIVNIDLPKRVGIKKLSSAIRVSHNLPCKQNFLPSSSACSLTATQAIAVCDVLQGLNLRF